jgi:hypothetical protein
MPNTSHDAQCHLPEPKVGAVWQCPRCEQVWGCPPPRSGRAVWIKIGDQDARSPGPADRERRDEDELRV